ncbi:MAG: manganese/iron ABC transporter ATP-binding protein [Pseudomonadota bacterium]
MTLHERNGSAQTGDVDGAPRTAGAPNHPAIEVTGVTVTYPNGLTAMRDASFTLPHGTICGLVGVNGSGKSTLFRAIMGFVTPRSGTVRIDGQPVPDAMRDNRVAYVPQSENVDWNFPVLVKDVVMMGRYGRMGLMRIPSSRDREIVQAALEQVDMGAYRNRQIGELSGGQKKRVFLARALAQESRVILLDEPFTGVDVKTESAIIELLMELRTSGHVMLVSTHNLGSVPDFCDQVILVKGTVIAAGPTANTFTETNLEAAFGGVLRQFRLGGADLHDDDDLRGVTVLTDDERPVVFYGTAGSGQMPRHRQVDEADAEDLPSGEGEGEPSKQKPPPEKEPSR